jgi:hypothetical protein
MEKERIRKIKKAIFSWPHNLIFILIVLAYLALTVYSNELYITFINILGYRKSFLIPFLISQLFIALLVPLTINLSILKIKEVQKINSIITGTSSSFLGTFFGVLGGACPGCFAGLLPTILGIFGISFSLIDLPLQGLEIQLVSIALLMFSTYLLTNPYNCRTSH